jgi:agmatinase
MDKLEQMAPLMELAGNLPFAGPTGFLRFPYGRDLPGTHLCVLGAPLDVTVCYRPGTRFGPRALREMSVFVLTELANLRRFQDFRCLDYGDSWFAPGDLAHALQQIEADAERILSAGSKVLGLGGEHLVSLPLLRAHARRHGPLGLLQFDSHSDLYDVWPQAYHGSVMARALEEGLLDPQRCLQIGIRSTPPATASGPDLPYLTADWVLDHGPAAVCREALSRLGSAPTYISFDIDFLDPAYAPGTGTPVIGGPSTNQARRILQGLTALNVVGADVVELCPAYDNPGQITALAAASMAFYLTELLLKADLETTTHTES